MLLLLKLFCMHTPHSPFNLIVFHIQIQCARWSIQILKCLTFDASFWYNYTVCQLPITQSRYSYLQERCCGYQMLTVFLNNSKHLSNQRWNVNL